jgi:hypothetical protein
MVVVTVVIKFHIGRKLLLALRCVQLWEQRPVQCTPTVSIFFGKGGG